MQQKAKKRKLDLCCVRCCFVVLYPTLCSIMYKALQNEYCIKETYQSIYLLKLSDGFSKQEFNLIKTWHLKALIIKNSWLQFNILQQLLLVICVRYRLTVLICDNMKYYLLLYKKGGSQNTGHRKWESLLHVLPRNFFWDIIL